MTQALAGLHIVIQVVCLTVVIVGFILRIVDVGPAMG